MWKIQRIKLLDGYKIWLEFADGVAGAIDLESDLWGPMAEPLREPARFAEVTIDEYGALAWPNGFDLAPDTLHREISVASGSPELVG